jgi:prevent-host-death family protein
MPIEEVGVAEAKRRFAELAERVSRGESFVILNRGRPTVALVPPQ